MTETNYSEKCVDCAAQAYAAIMYIMLVQQARLAKDAALAPNIHQQVTLSRMSAAAWDGFSNVAEAVEKEDYPAEKPLEQLAHIQFADVEARLRPGDWWERVIKTYITVGSCRDFLDHVLNRILIRDIELPDDIIAFDYSLGHEQWVVDLLENSTADDKLAPRLSLWGRRVVGDLIAFLSLISKNIPALFPDEESVAAMRDYVNQKHNERMARAGLAG